MNVKNFSIKNIKIQNFKSIEDLSIRLNDGLNILIGDNGAGKSNFLQFLSHQLSYDFTRLRYINSRYREDLFRGNYSIDFEYCYNSDIYTFHLTSNNLKAKVGTKYENQRSIVYSKYKNGTPIDKNIEINIKRKSEIDSENRSNVKKLQQEIDKIGLIYSIDLIEFDTPREIAYISQPGKISIHDDGSISEEDTDSTWPSSLFIVFDMDISDEIDASAEAKNLDIESVRNLVLKVFEKRKRKNKFIATLKQYTPIQDIQLNENLNIYKVDKNFIIENIVTSFKINNTWVPWSYLSDGTKRLFNIFSEILFQEGKVVLIEEPELGIHPDQLFKLLQFLKKQSETKQVIISTHSPISLDLLSPQELDSIIITKMTKSGTKMIHLNPSQKSKAQAYIKKVGSLSHYWLHSDLEK